MMDQNINEQIKDLAFKIRKSVENHKTGLQPATSFDEKIYDLIDNSERYNPWQIPEHVLYALQVLSEDLNFLSADNDLKDLQSDKTVSNLRVGVLLKEGSPLEGICELLLLACSGIDCFVKYTPSSKWSLERVLSLFDNYKSISKSIHLIESKFLEIEGIVTFAKLNSTQQEYFNKYPLLELAHDGSSWSSGDNDQELVYDKLAELICIYFGRGSRNVKVLFVNESFELSKLQEALLQHSGILFHNRYYNNYEYRKSAMIFNKIPFIPDYPVLITESPEQAGYTGVLCIQKHKGVATIEHNRLLDKFPLINHSSILGIESNSDMNLSTYRMNRAAIIKYIRILGASH